MNVSCRFEKYVLTTLILLAFSLSAFSQRLGQGRTDRSVSNEIAGIAARYANALDSLSMESANGMYNSGDTLSNPYYSTLFGSPLLYGGTVSRLMSLSPERGDTAAENDGLLSTRRVETLVEASDKSLADTYMYNPWLIIGEEAEEGTLNVDDKIRESILPKETLTEKFIEQAPEETISSIKIGIGEGEPEIFVEKPNFWTFKTNFSFQFTQNFVSENWHKGGESHHALLAQTVFEANYDNKQKLTFDNKLEMNLGFQTSAEDTEHKFKTNSDLIRLTNKLGLKAVKHWYYTVMLQSWTQFYHGYKANDPKVYSDFMSPFESLLSVGMDFKWTSKKKKFDVTATLSPLAVKLIYCDREKLVTDFGIDPRRHSLWNFGSNITVNYTWQMFKNVSWQGRIYFFTDYSKAQIEWENTFNLTINKYLSTKLFLYPRFDDSVKANKDKKYMQFYELLSLGLNLNF